MNVEIADFFPPQPVVLDDFYPDGAKAFFGRSDALRQAKRRLGPDSAAVLQALTQRLIEASDIETELVTIMEFCETVLRSQGVKMHTVREPK